MDDLTNFIPSGWKRDLIHIVGCYYASQIASFNNREWDDDCHKFLWVMEDCKDSKWLDIRELNPLQFMNYVAKTFKQATDHCLKGLSKHTGWI